MKNVGISISDMKVKWNMVLIFIQDGHTGVLLPTRSSEKDGEVEQEPLYVDELHVPALIENFVANQENFTKRN